MDLIDKLKYYSNSTQSKPDTLQNSTLQKLADNLKGILLEENCLPIIKREVNFSFNQLQIGSFQNATIRLPILTKGDFSKPININELLFFDLETTGLAGGAGTYPFLIGIAFFEDNNFKVIQYFLPEYERDIYAYLDIKKYLQQKCILASYNGKSYDYPLLKNRFILNRFDDLFKDFQHIDLLHLSRRVWKNSLDNCSLGNIEHQIFKFSRLNDIEGYLIPHAYFEFLQSGKSEEIVNIIMHNEQDLVSLGRLIFQLSRIENEKENPNLSNNEMVSLFDTAIKSNLLEKSQQLFELLKNRKITIPNKSMFYYSLLLKRNQKWEESIKIWEKLTQSKTFAFQAFEELAKYYEHRIKDFKYALEYVNRAFGLLNVMSELKQNNFKDNVKLVFDFRKNRLLKKIENDVRI